MTSVLQFKRISFGISVVLASTYEPLIANAWVENALLLVDGGQVPNKDVPGRTPDKIALFKIATENRAGAKGYSCCVDVSGFCAARAGCRDERFINRDDDNLDGIPDAQQQMEALGQPGHVKWRVGLNPSMFIAGARAHNAYIEPKPDSDDPRKRLPFRGCPFMMGDHGLEHVGVFVSDPVETSPGVFAIDTVEGGQVGSLGEQQVQFFHRTFVRQGNQYVMRGRILHGWVDVTKLPYTQPAEVPLDFDGGFPVDFEADAVPAGRGVGLSAGTSGVLPGPT